MPDEKKFLIHYSDYFSKNALTIKNSILLLLGFGILAGIIAVLVLQYHDILSGSFYIIANGASAGLLVVSLPALLSAALFKISIRRIHLKHILMALIISSLAYSFFIVINSIFFLFTKSYVVAYVILLLANASIFGYWFIVGRFLIGHRRGAVANGVIQPTLNVLFYIPLGKYLLNIHLLLLPLLIKLYAGMLVFLIIGYIFFYIIDRPTRKLLNISGIKIFTVMVNQWLYNIGSLEINMGIGIKKDIAVEMLILKHNTDYKAVFVKPDIHYGPFAGTGGAITTEYLGNFIAKRYNAAPFILHGAINVIYNPVSTSQIVGIAKGIEKKIADLKDTEFANARGSIGIGADGPCKAIDMRINNSSIVTLTKAPKITEDIDHEVGIELSKVAGLNSIIVDAHNSRFENASKDELKGIYPGSKYAGMYAEAIKHAKKNLKKDEEITFGASSFKIANMLKNPKDLGRGYTSVGVFSFGAKKFAMIYFDANNMLPKFRESILKHVKEKYNIECELYTTDTHSVNSLALPWSNVLGRFTKAEEMIKVLDIIIDDAIKNMSSISSSYSRFVMKDFVVWGKDAEKLITKISKDIIRTVKHVVPFIIAAGFVIAAWLIYLI